MRWLDPPPAGTPVCGGFDGASVSDCTVIKLETSDGLLFTPRYGPDRRPTIWNPAEWGGKTPRSEVDAAWAEINDTYSLERVYCDPWHFTSEIGVWARLYGEGKFIEWHTNRDRVMHEALELLVTDLATRTVRHDGCPITTQHVANARKLARPGSRYVLGKPSPMQKIDAGMGSVLAHKAAVDARADGWIDEKPDTRVFCMVERRGGIGAADRLDSQRRRARHGGPLGRSRW